MSSLQRCPERGRTVRAIYSEHDGIVLKSLLPVDVKQTGKTLGQGSYATVKEAIQVCSTAFTTISRVSNPVPMR